MSVSKFFCVLLTVCLLIASPAIFSVNSDSETVYEEGKLNQTISIEDWYDLAEVSNNLSSDHILENNLDNQTEGYREIVDEGGWEPIKERDEGFEGTFDGNGHSISDLFIDESDSEVGLFGRVEDGAIIADLSLEYITVGGDERVGGLAGYNDGKIVNCSVSGEMIGGEILGGLVGDNVETGEILRSYSDMKIEGTDGFLGGLVGGNSGDIKDSYAMGSVNGSENIGGLVGGNDNVGDIENTYSSTEIKSEEGSNIGGLVGMDQGTITDSDSFWDTEQSGVEESDGGTGKTTEEMKDIAIYTDTGTEGLEEPWDFVGNPNDDEGDENIWDIDEDEEINNGYPFLTWEQEKEVVEEHKVELTTREGEGRVEASWDGHEKTLEEVGDQFTVEEGTDVTFESEAAEGYEFVEWKDDAIGETDPFTTTIEGDYNLGISYELEEYEVSFTELKGSGEVKADIGENGEIDQTFTEVTDSFIVEHGEDVKFEAEPDEGYGFVEWKDDAVGETDPFTTEIESDYDIGVGFEELEEYELTVTVEEGGEDVIASWNDEEQVVEDEESFILYESTEVELIADAVDSWEFDEWTGDHQDSTSATSLIMNDDYNVTANFYEPEVWYELEVNYPEEEGTVYVDGEEVHDDTTEEFGEGTLVTLEAIPEEGWEFLEWSDEVEEPGEGETSITMDEDNEVTAYFIEKPTVELMTLEGDGALEANWNGENEILESIGDKFMVEHGEDVKFEAESDEGYGFVEWKDDAVGETDPFTTEIESDYDIGVEFEEVIIEEHELTVEEPEGEGEIYVDGELIDEFPYKGEYEKTTDVKLEAEVADGYEFVKWEVDDENYDEVEVNIPINEDKEVKAVFEEIIKQYNLTFVVENEDGESIKDAVVTVEEETLQTDEEGKVIFEDLEPDTYEYTIEKEGYRKIESEVELEADLTRIHFMLEEPEKHELLFDIEDENDQPLEGADVTLIHPVPVSIGFEEEIDYELIEEANGRIVHEVENISIIWASFTEDEAKEIVDTWEDRPEVTRVEAEEEIEGNVTEKTTNEDGEVVFEELKAGIYNYMIEKEGFETVDYDVTIEDEGVTESVILEEEYVEEFDITFELQDEDEENIENAEITVDGDTLETDEQGELVLEDMEPRTYNYTVEKDGYEFIEDEVTVDDENVVESVTLMEKEDDDDGEDEDTPGFTVLVLLSAIVISIITFRKES